MLIPWWYWYCRHYLLINIATLHFADFHSPPFHIIFAIDAAIIDFHYISFALILLRHISIATPLTLRCHFDIAFDCHFFISRYFIFADADYFHLSCCRRAIRDDAHRHAGDAAATSLCHSRHARPPCHARAIFSFSSIFAFRWCLFSIAEAIDYYDSSLPRIIFCRCRHGFAAFSPLPPPLPRQRCRAPRHSHERRQRCHACAITPIFFRFYCFRLRFRFCRHIIFAAAAIFCFSLFAPACHWYFRHFHSFIDAIFTFRHFSPFISWLISLAIIDIFIIIAIAWLLIISLMMIFHCSYYFIIIDARRWWWYFIITPLFAIRCH